VTEALLPVVREELRQLVEAGCAEIAIDEPSMTVASVARELGLG
jgi:5-methyltetrahydropteroyltriglutamate--homocysteine methyltransferase